jgi:hypothetical protein
MRCLLPRSPREGSVGRHVFVLFDVSGLKGGNALESVQKLTLTEVKAALARQGMTSFGWVFIPSLPPH